MADRPDGSKFGKSGVVRVIPEVPCPFCDLVRTGLPDYGLYEDRSFLVILDRASLGIGHCLIIPKVHVRQTYELDETTYTDLFLLARRLAPCLQRVTARQAIGYVIFGSGLPHAHLHLVPHNTSAELEHPQVQIVSDDQLRERAAYLRPLLQDPS
jgi:histidine triad (HIT) family protein